VPIGLLVVAWVVEGDNAAGRRTVHGRMTSALFAGCRHHSEATQSSDEP